MDNSIKISADISESANNLLAKPSKSIGLAVATAIDFFHNTLLLPMQKYNIRAQKNLEEYKKSLEDKSHLIPENQLSEPNMNIWGQTMDSLRWNLDDQQDYIRDMFTKILLADIDKRKKSKVLPSFIEIVKQLSYDDAQFLQLLNKIKGKVAFSTIEIRWEKPNGEYMKAIGSPLAVVLKNDEYITPDLKILDNLERLGIIKYQRDITMPKDKVACEKIFNNLKDRFPAPTQAGFERTIFVQEKIDITDFGKDFVSICIKD